MTEVKYHPFNADDANRISSALKTYCRSLGHRTNKVWLKVIDVEYGLSSILNGTVSSAIVDDSYLVVFSAGSTWYSEKLIVSEELVLTLGNHKSKFSVVTDFLEAVAMSINSSLITVGTAFAYRDEALVKLYSNHGFRPECVQLVKEVPWDSSVKQ